MQVFKTLAAIMLVSGAFALAGPARGTGSTALDPVRKR